MKVLGVTALLLAFATAGCTSLFPSDAGNPNGAAYAGSPGSVYDAAANPPQALGVVTYDPSAVPSNPVVSAPATTQPMARTPGR